MRLTSNINVFVKLIDSELAGRGAAIEEDDQGTPTQSHISPSILVYEEKLTSTLMTREGKGVLGSPVASRGAL